MVVNSKRNLKIKRKKLPIINIKQNIPKIWNSFLVSFH